MSYRIQFMGSVSFNVALQPGNWSISLYYNGRNNGGGGGSNPVQVQYNGNVLGTFTSAPNNGWPSVTYPFNLDTATQVPVPITLAGQSPSNNDQTAYVDQITLTRLRSKWVNLSYRSDCVQDYPSLYIPNANFENIATNTEGYYPKYTELSWTMSYAAGIISSTTTSGAVTTSDIPSGSSGRFAIIRVSGGEN